MPPIVIRMALSGSRLRRLSSALLDERLDAIGSKPGAVTYNYHRGVPAGQGLTLRQLDLPTADGIAVSLQSRVKAITQDRLGRLWMSMGSGTFRLDDPPVGPASRAWVVRRAWQLRSLPIHRDVSGSDSRTRSRCWTETGVRIFSGKDGVQVGAVTSIQGKGTTIWIGGELGLAFFDGSRFQPVNASDGSAFAGVSGIVAEADDGLWFSDNRGIIHIREDQLQQPGSGKVEFESFGLLDGLTTELRGSSRLTIGCAHDGRSHLVRHNKGRGLD